MTPAVAERYAAAWGTHLRSQTEGEVRIVLGRDPRPSGRRMVAAARCGLQAAGAMCRSGHCGNAHRRLRCRAIWGRGRIDGHRQPQPD